LLIRTSTPRSDFSSSAGLEKLYRNVFHLFAERIGALGRIGQRQHLMAGIEQAAGDVLARISVGSRNGDAHVLAPLGPDQYLLL